MTRSLRFLAFCLLLVVGLDDLTPSNAGEPLHRQIDKLIAAKADGAMARRTTDAEFLRRVYLDLTGTIPTTSDTREFLADVSPDKRIKLVDRLLSGVDYPSRMQELFDVMLMERRGENREWNNFLRRSFQENKPWNRLVAEILAADAENEMSRGAAFFLTKRLEKYGANPVDYPGLVRDVGRLFLGRDLECARCHDHPSVDDYYQVDYQGLFAFLGRTSIRSGLEFPAVKETPLTTKIEFKSVFDGIERQTGPRLPGDKESVIPVFKEGEEYQTPPDRKLKTPGVLKFSTLRLLSEQLPQSDEFSRNLANRLWFVMMGRGLVNPLDLHHRKNPASHPKLLDLLTQELVAHEFDVKWMLRELALCETYGRSSLLPEGVQRVPPESFRVAIERPLSAEQMMRAMLRATGTVISTSVDDKESSESDDLRKKFLAAMAHPPREPEVDYSPTVRSALFLHNDAQLLEWCQPEKDNLAARLGKLNKNPLLAEELYLSVLTRRPSIAEVEEIAAYLEQNAEQRTKRIGHLIWALMASTEFNTNH